MLFDVTEQSEGNRYYSFSGHLSNVVSQGVLLGGGTFFSAGHMSAAHRKVWREGAGSVLSTGKAEYVKRSISVQVISNSVVFYVVSQL